MNRIILVFISLLIFSCSKDATEDFDIKRSNIVGDWQITQASQEIRADTIYAESSSMFDISFNQDGTGIKESFLGTDINFEWLYQYNPEMVVINGIQEGLILSSVQFYNVSKNEMERQIWEFEVEPQNGIVDIYKHTWKMERK